MVPTTLVEKLKTIYNLVSSNPFFFVALISALILLILIVIILKKEKKINIKLFLIVWATITTAILVKYHKFILSLSDSLIENIVMAIYFPNFAIFTIVLIISNVSLFFNVTKKDINIAYKTIQIPSAVLINFLFVLILDIVATNHIDVYSQTEVYQNNNLYVLLELCMLIFTISIILTLMVYMIKRLLKTIPKNNNTKIASPQQFIGTVENTKIINANPVNIGIPPITSTTQPMPNTISATNYTNIRSNIQYPNSTPAPINDLITPVNNQISHNVSADQTNNLSSLNQPPIINNNIQTNSQNNDIEIL